ncbi:MAG: hypothetical protein ACK4GD_02305 [Sphingomonadaceae bacterium]
MHRAPRVLTLAVSIAILSGCAGDGGRYPSLAMRPAERVEGTFVPAPAAITAAPMAEGTLGRLGDLEAAARTAHARFAAQAPAARSRVQSARGANVADNRWAEAQITLAELDSIRSEAAIVLAEIDLLFVDATLSFSDREAIERSRAAIVAMIAQEDDVLAELRGGR